MASPRILVREDDQPKNVQLAPAPDFGWRLIGVLGLVFLAVGFLDIALAWYPFNYGNPEWEFATVSSTLDSFPVPTLGLALLLGAAVATGMRRGVRVWSVVLIVVAVLVLMAGVIYLLNLPLAFQSVQEPVLRTGLKKAVTKTIGQLVLYPAAFVTMAIMGLRHAGTKR